MSVPEPKDVPIISGRAAQKLVECPVGCHEFSLDLDLTVSEVDITPEGIVLTEGHTVDRDELESAWRHREDCIILSEKGCIKAYLYDEERGKLYKLYQPFEDRAPTVIINNATMHSIVQKGPWEDEEDKVGAISLRGGACLDTCCGLGYSAQLLARGRVESVFTCEEDPNVLELAAVNPWSRGLFRNPKINIVQRDVRDYVRDCEDASFSVVFHDPPTVYQAGELYSEDLYREFARLLHSGGTLYHYVGAPGRKRGQDYAGGVMDRLHRAGFGSVKRTVGGVRATFSG